MSDARIIMIDGLLQSNIRCVTSAFTERFITEYSCSSLDLTEQRKKLIKDLKNYVLNMDYKNKEYISKLLSIFNTFILSKKELMESVNTEYLITSNYSPFTINTMILLAIIRKEFMKFHENQKTIDHVMDTLYRDVTRLELDYNLIPVHRIVTLNCFTETATVPLQKGESDSLTRHKIQLEKIRSTYTLVNNLLGNKFLHLRCPEYIGSPINVKRCMNELTGEKNLKTLFY